jgi:hypothetical protein
MKFEKNRWGVIGCADVTEMKSGPAFQKGIFAQIPQKV